MKTAEKCLQGKSKSAAICSPGARVLLVKDVIDAMHEFAEQHKPKWIPVAEGLPEKEKIVNLSVTNCGTLPGYYHERGHWIIIRQRSSDKETWYSIVTHWCELPTPPTE